MVHDSVPADCIDKVVSENGETFLYQRLSTPAPAPKINFKKCLELTAAAAAARHTFSRTRTPVAKEENSFQADLKIQGVHKMQ